MNILFDIRTLGDKNLTGVGFYTLNVLENLLKKDRENRYFLFLNKSKAISRKIQNKLKEFEKSDQVKILKLNYPNKLFNFLIKFKFITLDKFLSKKFELQFDLYFATNINYINLSDKIKFVLTVHDLSFILFSEFFNLKQKLWHRFVNYKKLYQRANIILSVSENTKQDLIDLNIPEEKIKIINLGINKEYFESVDILRIQEIKKKYNLDENYILFLGTLEPRKNIKLILAAFKQVLFEKPSLKLVLTGKMTRYSRKLLRRYDDIKENIRIFDYLTLDEKKVFYSLAQLTVYPSFYEGFGLPVLESISCNCPIVIGRNSALLENFSNVALTVDVENVEELKDLICYTIKNRKRLVERLNKINWQDYSWENYAIQFLNIIKNL